MATFPTIYLDAANTRVQNPIVGKYSDTLAFDPTIRSIFAGGYAATRARFTRLPRKWPLQFEGALKAGKNIIRTFEEARVSGSESFTWTNPEDSTAYTVRFLGPVLYAPWDKSNYRRWNITFVLEEV